MITSPTLTKVQWFSCNNCYYTSCRKSQYDRHLLTDKHKKLTNTYVKSSESSGKKYKCECGNEYLHRQSLYSHKKKCQGLTESKNLNYDINNKDNIIMMLIKQNSELIKEQTDIKQIILDLVKNGINNTTNNNINTNSNNKTFNLHFFLNETCKNAMNINDFVDSINLQLSDLEKVGELGFIQGITNIIVENLNALDVTKRPIHCTDKKREVIYIKDDGQWEKEDDEKKKIRSVIKKVANKNIKLITQFREKYPECKK